MIIPEANKKDIPEEINRYFPNLNIDYFTVPEHKGTAESLRLVGEKIKVSVNL